MGVPHKWMVYDGKKRIDMALFVGYFWGPLISGNDILSDELAELLLGQTFQSLQGSGLLLPNVAQL